MGMTIGMLLDASDLGDDLCVFLVALGIGLAAVSQLGVEPFQIVNFFGEFFQQHCLSRLAPLVHAFPDLLAEYQVHHEVFESVFGNQDENRFCHELGYDFMGFGVLD